MELGKLIAPLKTLCENTGIFIQDNFGKLSEYDIVSKEKNSLVSFVDRESEKMITNKLRELLPDAGFLTEENMVENKELELMWIVDPLDGTTNFVKGIPHFAISIALARNNQVILGVVYDVMRKEFYKAIRGKGAYLNDTTISVSDVSKMDEACIATGFPYDKALIKSPHINTLQFFLQNCRIVRRLGSAALDLCFVAKGSFELYYEKYLNAWDLAAGALIVEEAGGRISTVSTKGSFLTEKEIIAYNPEMEIAANKVRELFA